MSSGGGHAPALRGCFSNYFAIIVVQGQWLITITRQDKKRIRRLEKSLRLRLSITTSRNPLKLGVKSETAREKNKHGFLARERHEDTGMCLQDTSRQNCQCTLVFHTRYTGLGQKRRRRPEASFGGLRKRNDPLLFKQSHRSGDQSRTKKPNLDSFRYSGKISRWR